VRGSVLIFIGSDQHLIADENEFFSSFGFHV
jgi:hypothetical protein